MDLNIAVPSLKLKEFNLRFKIVNFENSKKIITAAQKIPEIDAKCFLEVTSIFCDFNHYYHSKCFVNIHRLSEKFQLSGKYKIRIVCTVGGEIVFNQEKAITSTSIRIGNDGIGLFENEVLANGSLILDVKVELYGTALDCTVFSNPVKNYKAFTESIGKMQQCSQFSDFTFIVQSQDFEVHRVILAQASPVFAALFLSDMQEAKSKKCVIKDIKPSIFEHLLNYIYKLELPQDLELVAKELYEASHYYEISELKNICLLQVSTTLKVVNAIELFCWSDKYDENLKVKAWEIIKHDILEIFVPLNQKPPTALLFKQMLETNEIHEKFWRMQKK